MNAPELSVVEPAAPTKRNRKRKAKARATKPEPAAPRRMSAMAWSLCVGLPLISFGASWLAGECYMTGHNALGVSSTVLVLFSLLVSAPHVAAAVLISWRTTKLDGWLVAAALEGAIIVLDMAHLAGPESLRLATLIASAVPIVAVAALNSIAVRAAGNAPAKEQAP